MKPSIVKTFDVLVSFAFGNGFSLFFSHPSPSWPKLKVVPEQGVRVGSRALPVSALHKRLNGGEGGGGGGQQGGGGGQHHHQPSAHDQQEQLARIVQQKRENCALVAQQQVLTKTENYFLNCFFFQYFFSRCSRNCGCKFSFECTTANCKDKIRRKML